MDSPSGSDFVWSTRGQMMTLQPEILLDDVAPSEDLNDHG
jgi:hypothetical protein